MAEEQQWANLYDRVLERPKEIARVFIDYFGDENVDLRFITLPTFISYVETYSSYEYFNRNISILEGNCNFTPRIIVRFPEVKVTNEYNESTIIKELYVEIPVSILGKYSGTTFRFARSHYTYVQWVKGYIHSHAHTLDKDHPECFSSCCLGTGPIKYTIAALAVECDMDRWQLFCVELGKYVTVESVTGTPYIRLSYLVLTENNNIPVSNFTWTSCVINSNKRYILGEFVKWLFANRRVEITFNGFSYDLAYSYYNFRVSMSNWFIQWYNSVGNRYIVENYNDLLGMGFLKRCKVVNNTFIVASRNELVSIPRERRLFTFKGRDVLLHVEQPVTTDEAGFDTFLSHEITSFLYIKLIKIINYEYGCKGNQRFSSTSEVSYMF